MNTKKNMMNVLGLFVAWVDYNTKFLSTENIRCWIQFLRSLHSSLSLDPNINEQIMRRNDTEVLYLIRCLSLLWKDLIEIREDFQNDVP